MPPLAVSSAPSNASSRRRRRDPNYNPCLVSPRTCFFLICLLAPVVVVAFVREANVISRRPRHKFVEPRPYRRPLNSRLFGINEWRADSTASFQENDDTDKEETKSSPPDETSSSKLLLLPVPIQDALVIGQSITLTNLKEGRYFDLIDECIQSHHGVIGIAIMGDDSLLKTIPLCEMTEYDIQAGYRGKVTASMTLKCVGRAQMAQLLQMKPIMMATCIEVFDDRIQNEADMEKANRLVDQVEEAQQQEAPQLASVYQQHFWMALTAMKQTYDYKPSLLPPIPTIMINTQLEVEAASWAMLFAWWSSRQEQAQQPKGDVDARTETPSKRRQNDAFYQAMAMTSLVQRLEFLLELLKNPSCGVDNKNANPDSVLSFYENNYDSGFE